MDEINMTEIASLLDTVYYNTGGLIHEAPQFNLIKIFFRKLDDEENLHSTFIAELLNPEGSHGFKDAFIKAWLKRMKINNRFIPKQIDVRKEFMNIDILVSNRNNQHIIIENKINAKDQEMQLPRYIKKIQKNFNPAEGDIFIVYLTLDGHYPEENQKKELEKMNFLPDNYCFSYSKDITEWIKDCIGLSAQNPTLRESLVMYLDIVEILTNQKGDNEMNQKVKEEILKRPANLQAAIAISDGLIEVKIELQKKFWKMLEKKMQDKLHEIGLKWKQNEAIPRPWSTDDNIKNYYRVSRESCYGQETCLGRFDKDTEIYFRIELGKELFYGILGRKVNIEKDEAENEFNNTNDRFKSLKELAQKICPYVSNTRQNWIACTYEKQKLAWVSFKDKEIFRMADGEYLETQISKLADEMVYFIREFRDKAAAKGYLQK